MQFALKSEVRSNKYPHTQHPICVKNYLLLEILCKNPDTLHVKHRDFDSTMYITSVLTYFLAACPFAAADSNGINLYTGANDGNLTSLRLSKSGEGYTLGQISATGSCGAQPVWLDLDKPNNVLYCLNRPGSITTYATSADGNLGAPLNTGNTTIGPVSSAFYNSGTKRGLAAAH